MTPADEGFTPADEETALDEDTTTPDSSMPRRAAMGVVGGLAGLAALKATSASAHAGQAGLLVRIRRVTKAVRVPNNSNRVLRMVCPSAPSGQRAYVFSGGYAHTTNNPRFMIKTNAPDTAQSWVIDGHNVDTGGAVDLGGYAICGYFRT
jgi:hypothetical protein